jgi:glycosyltransferase involved in cell wall biosynthesis
MKVLIFIVAYNAEDHLESVFARIPWDRLQVDGEVLVIEDASSDKTAEVMRKLKAKTFPWKITFLSNPVNLGYGGNQKIGYLHAIRNGFDAVVLLHGDGQYAPEKLPEMIAPLLGEQGADAVFGSRMMVKKDALKGGMPLYKWIGNQVLTGLENTLAGTSLSEFHTGYRAYSTKGLAKVPFDLCTSDFHFDTEIILQLRKAGAKIVEIAIPTHYGEEVCHVNGFRYAWGCLVSCVQSKLTQWGIFYSRKFDIRSEKTRYESKLDQPSSSQSQACSLVPGGSSILDVGGGNGWTAEKLSKEKGCTVCVLDNCFTFEGIPGVIQVHHDLNNPLPELPDASCIMALDILEHLPRPMQRDVLGRLRRRYCQPAAKFIVTVPNTAFLPLRIVFFLFGRLNYGIRGILDETHCFLFTESSLRELFSDAMYEIELLKGIPAPYLLLPIPRGLAILLDTIHSFLVKILPRVFAYQFLVVARPLPTLETLLGNSVEI